MSSAFSGQKPVRVMLCDDSATVRGILARLLGADPGIEIVARVGDGRQALDALPVARPDVVLLDLEMPVMDGMTALPLLLKAEPRPIVIVASALTQRGAAAAMAALRAGASDYIPKPGAGGGGAMNPVFRTELLEKVKGWARMRRAPAMPAPVAAAAAVAALVRPGLVAVGSSTGGPQALAVFLRALAQPPGVPMVIVQHMPAGFTTMLADHLNRVGALRVSEAKDGEPLRPGHAYLAPGDRHLVVERSQMGLLARLRDDPPEHFCRPAVDPMLRSALQACDGRVLAVILTGMGQDGLAGCRALAAAGGTVLAQDEASSVVWGMPGAVARAGLAREVLPLERLAARVAAIATGPGRMAS
ncbi:chemotaxis-specific protein-glutamate methyltransferase CheB [Roseomonas xinghualingensis]|uniref:chemotaxis-specific protein-glutamate methyltransferase CheB n=1 Tax=Roseomonas xinghualingensis TaxID=2986475 RepID=UPI0021F0D7F6|nr:chemotaxis-specific protein-glutamate methyltransferase CheB [Roseomonas sp. SXEYE001]MCV4207677.1 chemotaxis-specific protein-glutamate methyltransferase CheB [Roseomonas sp. SXEYE001]